MKIIIDIDETIDPSSALDAVNVVIQRGRVSQAAGILHYCWVTVFNSGIIVASKRKRSKGAADSFIVYRS